MVVEVVGPEGMAGHLVEPRDRGSGVVTAVDELFDPKYCLSNRDLPVVRNRTASQRVAQLHAVDPTCECPRVGQADGNGSCVTGFP